MPLLASGNTCLACGHTVILFLNTAPTLHNKYQVYCRNTKCHRNNKQRYYDGTDKQKAWNIYNTLAPQNKNKGTSFSSLPKNKIPKSSINILPGGRKQTFQTILGPKKCPDCKARKLKLQFDNTTWRIWCANCDNILKQTTDTKEAGKAWDYWANTDRNNPKKVSTKRYTTKEVVEINKKEKRKHCIRCNQRNISSGCSHVRNRTLLHLL